MLGTQGKGVEGYAFDFDTPSTPSTPLTQSSWQLDNSRQLQVDSIKNAGNFTKKYKK